MSWPSSRHIVVFLAVAWLLLFPDFRKAAAQLPGYFTDTVPVASVSNLVDDSWGSGASRISRSGLEMYFTRDQISNNRDQDIWVARRRTTAEDFGQPYALGSGINASSRNLRVGSISSDGLSLYFQREDGPYANSYVATRESIAADFDNTVPLTSINTQDGQGSPFISEDGLKLYFHHYSSAGLTENSDLYVATRSSAGGEFSNPVAVSGVNSSGYEWAPYVTADERYIFFNGYDRPQEGGLGEQDIWFATANAVTGEFENVLNLGEPVNSEYNDMLVDLPAVWPEDSSLVYFTSDRPVNGIEVNRIWQATWRLSPQAGDADLDLDFDQYDLVQVLVAAKYLTGQGATWGEGDWNGVPGGTVDSPPVGDGKFDQLDIVFALTNGHYLNGPYAAMNMGSVNALANTPVTQDVGASGPGATMAHVPELSTSLLIIVAVPALLHLRHKRVRIPKLPVSA